MIEANKVWSLDGKRGEGIVVASADTGVVAIPYADINRSNLVEE
jgi:hypothetical protein